MKLFFGRRTTRRRRLRCTSPPLAGGSARWPRNARLVYIRSISAHTRHSAYAQTVNQACVQQTCMCPRKHARANKTHTCHPFALQVIATVPEIRSLAIRQVKLPHARVIVSVSIVVDALAVAHPIQKLSFIIRKRLLTLPFLFVSPIQARI